MSDDCDDNQLDQREPLSSPPPPEETTSEPPELGTPESEPPGQQVFGRGELRDLICQLGSLQPQILNGLFMNLLADHFSDPRYIWQEQLKRYQWRPGPDSDIKIMTNAQWQDVERTNEPLTIVLKRGPQRYQPIGIGGKGAVEVDGESLHHMVVGAHTFVATGGTGAEAELLGEELAALWTHESWRMTHEFFFHHFQPGELGSLGVVDDLGGALGVTFVVNYAYETVTRTRPVQPRLKVFDARPNPSTQQ